MKLLLFVSFICAISAVPPGPAYSSSYSSVSQQPNKSRLRYLARQVPKPVYGPPPQSYGPPQGASGAKQPTTTERDSESVATNGRIKSSKSGKLVRSEENFVDQGIYYIYHPSGLLQRVAYSTRNDITNMGYTARLRYQNVQPIADPIYTYDPETYALKQVVV